MILSSLRSFRATSIRHHDRGLTLVFGSDGQVSLIGFDGSTPQVPYTLTVSNTGVPTPSTRSPPNEPTAVSPVPNLEATSASLAGSSSLTPTPARTSSLTSTFISSSLTSSSYDPSSTTTDTDTNLPSIPTLSYPAPSPTPVSNPKDHGVGAPFYLAIVLASISFVGCIAAFIAWWIRSRARRRNLELDDPWHHPDTISDNGNHFTDNPNKFGKGAQKPTETQTRPYYLPASIVRRSSSNLLAVPHMIRSSEAGMSRNDTSSAVTGAGRYPSLHPAADPRSKNSSTEPKRSDDIPSSQAIGVYSRPGTERLQTGLSVQESTRTLGRLRVANRVPGDITSGDEGGMNVPRSQNNAGLLPVANVGELDVTLVRETAKSNAHSDDIPLEPPGPATLPWGRRTDTIAALRRSRRTPGATVQTYKNARYGGYLYPTVDGEASAMSRAPAAVNQQETQKIRGNPSLDPLNWTNSLKSSFWLAVDSVTGNRTPDPEPRSASGTGGSRFTPAPQRVASRRSPVSLIRSAASSPLPVTCTQEMELTSPDKSLATGEMSPNPTYPSIGSSLTGRNEPEIPPTSEFFVGRADPVPPRVSRLNHDFNENTRRRPPDSLKADTGSVYSTDSAAARANLRKYGYGDSIPSTWSALGRNQASQSDLDSLFLPLPRPVLTSSPSPLSVTPSQLTLDSGILSSSASTRARTRTPMPSESDFIRSEVNTLRSNKSANTTSCGETSTNSSTYDVSRNGTVQSGRGTIGHGAVPSHSSSTTSSMLSRKKGVTRKRPRPPLRAPSSASSVQSMESGLSTRDVAVRRALLERRKKVKATEGLKGREDSPLRTSRDASNLV